MPTNEIRPDQSLHEDMRWLASALGRVILRLEGQEVFNAVEELRTASRDRRKGTAGAKDLRALLTRVEQLPTELAAPVARAFTLFFLLINNTIRRGLLYDHGDLFGRLKFKRCFIITD